MEETRIVYLLFITQVCVFASSHLSELLNTRRVVIQVFNCLIHRLLSEPPGRPVRKMPGVQPSLQHNERTF